MYMCSILNLETLEKWGQAMNLKHTFITHNYCAHIKKVVAFSVKRLPDLRKTNDRLLEYWGT